MKKLFVAVLALAALAACNKENVDTFVTSNQKAVSITIVNPETRALVEAGGVDDVDAVGADGVVLAKGTSKVVAQANELQFLFANEQGMIVDIRSYTNGVAAEGNTENNVVVTFHNVAESAWQVAVVRYGDMTALEVGDNLSAVRDEAKNEANNAGVVIDSITLYAAAQLSDSGETCTYNHAEFKLYKASLNLAPLFSRFEINRVKCLDLGEVTYKVAMGEETTVVKGYDELTLASIVFGSEATYKYDFAADTKLLGKLVYTDGVAGVRADYDNTRCYNFGTDAEALAWNIAEQAAPSYTVVDEKKVASNPMVLSLNAIAYDSNIDTNTTVTVVRVNDKDGNAVETFEAGKIYNMDLDFAESNLDSFTDGICVEVTVTISDWEVVVVTPEFLS